MTPTQRQQQAELFEYFQTIRVQLDLMEPAVAGIRRIGHPLAGFLEHTIDDVRRDLPRFPPRMDTWKP